MSNCMYVVSGPLELSSHSNPTDRSPFHQRFGSNGHSFELVWTDTYHRINDNGEACWAHLGETYRTHGLAAWHQGRHTGPCGPPVPKPPPSPLPLQPEPTDVASEKEDVSDCGVDDANCPDAGVLGRGRGGVAAFMA